MCLYKTKFWCHVHIVAQFWLQLLTGSRTKQDTYRLFSLLERNCPQMKLMLYTPMLTCVSHWQASAPNWFNANKPTPSCQKALLFTMHLKTYKHKRYDHSSPTLLTSSCSVALPQAVCYLTVIIFLPDIPPFVTLPQAVISHSSSSSLTSHHLSPSFRLFSHSQHLAPWRPTICHPPSGCFLTVNIFLPDIPSFVTLHQAVISQSSSSSLTSHHLSPSPRLLSHSQHLPTWHPTICHPPSGCFLTVNIFLPDIPSFVTLPQAVISQSSSSSLTSHHLSPSLRLFSHSQHLPPWHPIICHPPSGCYLTVIIFLPDIPSFVTLPQAVISQSSSSSLTSHHLSPSFRLFSHSQHLPPWHPIICHPPSGCYLTVIIFLPDIPSFVTLPQAVISQSSSSSLTSHHLSPSFRLLSHSHHLLPWRPIICHPPSGCYLTVIIFLPDIPSFVTLLCRSRMSY